MDDEEQSSLDLLSDDSGGVGEQSALAVLANAFDPSTTKEAHDYAKRFLDKQLASDTQAQAKGVFDRMEANAEAARRAIRAARTKLAARRYGNAEALLTLSGALGSGTLSGRSWETVGNVSRSMIEPIKNRRAWEEGRDKDVLSLDTALSNVDTNLLNQRLKLLGMTNTADAAIAKEALKTMGRPIKGTSGIEKIVPDAAKAVDRVYSKDYVDWIQGGAADAVKSLEELGTARDRLRGYSIDSQGNTIEGKKTDRLTGPVVGSIGTVPLIGKPTQDIFFPEASDVQEIVEATVQRSLRPILGAQFTEKEGERLIQRVYNPRLDEKINAARLDRLIMQLKRAYDNKNAAADYFRKHGTLFGFKGKTRWTVDDFGKKGTLPGDPGYEEEQPEVASESPDDVAPATEPRVLRYEDLVKKRKGFAHGGYADGGRVRLTMPDGTVIDAPAGTTQEDAEAAYAGPESPEELPEPVPVALEPPEDGDTGIDILKGAGAIGGGSLLGGLASKYGLQGALAGIGRIPGVRASKAERSVLEGLDRSGRSLNEIAADVSSARRAGTPAVLADVAGPEIRGATEDAIGRGGPEALDFLKFLETRQGQSRGRASDVVNRALKPDEYFSEQEKLKSALYQNSRPLYRAAYDAFPTINSKAIFDIMDTPSGKRAVKNAIKSIRDTPGKTIGKTDALGMIKKPSLEFLDQVKQELDDMIVAEEGSGANYKSTGKGKRLRSLRDKLRNEMDLATVDSQTGESLYGKARAQWAGDLEMLDALRIGREDFSRMQPSEFSSYVKGLSFSERDALRTGVAQKLFEMIDNPAADINPAKKITGSPATMAKLRTLFDKPNEFKIFSEALKREGKLYDSSRRLIRRGEDARARLSSPGAKVDEKAGKTLDRMRWGYFGYPVRFAMDLLRSNPNLTEKQADEVVKIIRSGTPAELKELQSRLGSKMGRSARTKSAASKAGKVGAVLGALAGAGYMVGDQQSEEDRPELVGLTDEEKEMADRPAYADGGLAEDMARLRHYAGGGKVRDYIAVADILRKRQAMDRMIEPAASGKVILKPEDAEKLHTQYLKGVTSSHDAIDDPGMINMQLLESALRTLQTMAKRYMPDFQDWGFD